MSSATKTSLWRLINLKSGGEASYTSNEVRSSRYTALNFFPKNVLEQFRRLTNVWFLLVALAQAVGDWNEEGRWTTVAPLVLLLLIRMVKDGYYDYQRHLKDARNNGRTYQVWDGASYCEKPRSALCVGNYVLVREGSKAPADMLIIAVGNAQRACYLDVSPCYGDFDLISKHSIKETAHIVNSLIVERASGQLNRLSGLVKVGEPNPDFGTLEATIKLPGSPKAVAIGVDSFVMRSAIIKVAPWVIGLVIYTGTETKVLLNSEKTRAKTTRLEETVNRWMAYFIAAILALALLLAACSANGTSSDRDNFGMRFLVFAVLFSSLAPISLFVTMDVIRVLQGVAVQRDPNLMSNVQFKTPDISENLGQLEYIFAEQAAICESMPTIDLLIVGEEEYVKATLDDELVPLTKNLSRDLQRTGDEGASTDVNHLLLSEDGRTFLTTDMSDLRTFDKLKRIGFEGGDSPFEQFFECLSLCTSLIPNEDNLLISAFKADESLMQTLKSVGCDIERRAGTNCELNFFGKMRHYEIVAYWEQTATTKRTRVVVQRTGESTGTFYVKGPLTVMGNVLGVSSHQFKSIEQMVNNMGMKGMAPIVAGGAHLSEAKMEAFRKKVASVQLAIADVDAKMNKLFESLEEDEDVQYLGIAGVSMQAKQAAKDTIRAFTESGIKTWLLSSGSETKSLATAFSCGIAKQDQTIIHLKAFQSEETLQQELVRCIRYCISGHMSDTRHFNYSLSDGGFLKGRGKIERSKTDQVVLRDIIDDLSYHPENLSYCLSIDQLSFQQALNSEQCSKYLAYLLFCASSVCFSSLLPVHKKQVIQFVKESFSFKPVTMAIGSDASGMAMMQAADVGVAITDKSRFAEHYSDIVVGELGDLGELVLTHGQWNYMRMSKVILLFLFKNILLTCTLIWFSLLSDYSGSPFLDFGLVTCYHLFFTSLPLIVIGTTEKHIDSVDISTVPLLYHEGLLGLRMNRKVALKYIISAVVQSLVISGLLYPASVPVLSHGRTESLSSLSVLFSIVLVLTSLTQATIDCDSIIISYCLVTIVSAGLLFVYLGITNYYENSDLFGALSAVFHSSNFVFSLFLAPLACFIIAYAFSAYKKLFYPSLTDCYLSDRMTAPITQYFKAFPRLHQFKYHLKRMYRKAHLLTSTVIRDSYHLSPFSLRFASSYIESQYRSLYFASNLALFRGVIVCVWIFTVVWIIVEGVITQSNVSYNVYRAVISVVFLSVLGISFSRRFQKNYITFTIVFIVIGLVAKLAAELMYSIVGGMAAAIIPMVTFILLNVDFVYITLLTIANILLFTIPAGVVLGMESNSGTEAGLRLACYEVLLISLTFVAGRAGYALEKANKVEYQVRSNTENEAEKTRNILSLLLPPFVISKVKKREQGKFIAEDQGDVTVIFCDIYDFDSICVLYKPQELTALLDEVFQQFDDLCAANGVVKIETVGKTYMACAGMKYVEQELSEEMRTISHPRRAVEFAFDLLRAASSYKIKGGQSLQLKIGINSGPVISGVVGYHKPQFSLVGDTVNTASRMCSTLDKVDSIQLSTLTRSMMLEQQGLAFEPRTVFAKGKGNIPTFIVTEVADTERLHENSRTLQMPKKSDIIPTLYFLISDETEDYATRKTTNLRLDSLFPVLLRKKSMKDAAFKEVAAAQSKEILKWNMIANCITQIALLIVRLAMWELTPNLVCWEVLFAQSTLALLPLLYIAASKRWEVQRIPIKLQVSLSVCVSILSVFDIIFETDYDHELVAIHLLYLYLLMTWSYLTLFYTSMLLAAILLLIWIVLIVVSDSWANHLVLLVFIAVYVSVNNYSIYIRERQLRLYAELKKLEEKEVSKNEKLLAQMMPKSVYEKLKQDLPVTDRLRNMSILFADIVGFTNWSSDKSPEEVVGMLSALFTQFDLLCVRFKLYKVHTIGDCYVVMGFDGATDAFDPSMGCLRVFCMGHEMIRTIREVNEREGIELNMRIGIHTGEVIAGITGRDVVRYDIYGSAVMVANKMESNGSPGQVNVSEVTREVLERVAPGLLEYSDNKEVEAKSINKRYMSFFVKVLDEEKLFALANEE